LSQAHEARFWADEEADLLAADRQHVIRDSKTPSGTVPISGLRGPIITDALYRTFKGRGLAIRYVFTIDDYDPMDSASMKQQEGMAQHMGKPLCDIPSPDAAVAPDFARYHAARGGHRDRHRQQHVLRVAVAHDGSAREALRIGPADFARGEAGRKLPSDPRRQAGIARIAPVGVPAGLGLQAQRDPVGRARQPGGVLGHQLGYGYYQIGFVDPERYGSYYYLKIAILVFHYFRLAPSHHSAPARAVSMKQVFVSENNSARGKIRPLDELQKVLGGGIRVFDQMVRRLEHFPKIVRGDVGGHTDGDAESAV